MFGAVKSSMLHNSIYQHGSRHIAVEDDLIMERSVEDEQASVIYGTTAKSDNDQKALKFSSWHQTNKGHRFFSNQSGR